jgi:hypothetical protein
MFMAATTKRRWQALRARPHSGRGSCRTIASSWRERARRRSGCSRIRNDQALPIFEGVMGPPTPGHAIDQTATFERLAQRLVAIGLRRNSLARRLGSGLRPNGRHGHRQKSSRPAGQVHSLSPTARCPYSRNEPSSASSSPARPDREGSYRRFLGRTLDRSLDQRGVHQRPALDYEAERIELTVPLRKQHRRKAEPFGCLAKKRQIEAWSCVLASKGKP